MPTEKSCGAIVFTEQNGIPLFLLVRERAGHYSFPKGHMEGSETEMQTAQREIREETGLTVDFLEGFRRVDAFLQRENGRWKEVVYFLARYEGQTPVRQEGELTGWALLPFEEAIARFQFDSQKRILREAQDFLLARKGETGTKGALPMNLTLLPVTPADLPQFKRDMQEAFQKGAEEGGFPADMEILPEADIDRSLNAAGSAAYKAVLDGSMAGGAIVVLHPERQEGHLDFLYVKHGVQSRGVGKFIWFAIEKKHPEITVWETCTPYFEKRNLHFYVNVCRFHVTEFYNARHPDPHFPDEQYSDDEGGFEGMFGFRKEIAPPAREESPVRIETPRLILRPFREGDAPAVFAYTNAQTVHCFACMHFASLQDAEKEILSRGKDGCYLAIVRRDTGEVIGEIFAGPEKTAPEQETPDTWSPCWMLHPDHQGQGFAYEAARAYFDMLFREKGARRIYAWTETDNLPSQRLCEKLGMRKEGEFREFVTFVDHPDGSPLYETTLQYAILKKEWEQ